MTFDILAASPTPRATCQFLRLINRTIFKVSGNLIACCMLLWMWQVAHRAPKWRCSDSKHFYTVKFVLHVGLITIRGRHWLWFNHVYFIGNYMNYSSSPHIHTFVIMMHQRRPDWLGPRGWSARRIVSVRPVKHTGSGSWKNEGKQCD